MPWKDRISTGGAVPRLTRKMKQPAWGWGGWYISVSYGVQLFEPTWVWLLCRCIRSGEWADEWLGDWVGGRVGGCVDAWMDGWDR